MSQQYVKAGCPLSDVTARVSAAATEAHRTLGPDFEEVIYQCALARASMDELFKMIEALGR